MLIGITGGTGSGKTTVIKSLESLGYPVVHEAARKIIEEKLLLNPDLNILEYLTNNRYEFQKEVIKRQIEHENKVLKENPRRTIFCDRTIIDSLAFLVLDGIDKIPEEINLYKNRYDKVFCLEPLNVYVNDEIRKEDFNTARKLHYLNIKCYEKQGINLIRVPRMSVDDRVEFIIKNV